MLFLPHIQAEQALGARESSQAGSPAVSCMVCMGMVSPVGMQERHQQQVLQLPICTASGNVDDGGLLSQSV